MPHPIQRSRLADLELSMRAEARLAELATAPDILEAKREAVELVGRVYLVPQVAALFSTVMERTI